MTISACAKFETETFMMQGMILSSKQQQVSLLFGWVFTFGKLIYTDIFTNTLQSHIIVNNITLFPVTHYGL